MVDTLSQFSHKVICDDCLNVLRAMPDNCIDLIIADPPYDIQKISKGGTVNDIKCFNKSLKALEDQNLIYGYDIPLYCGEFIRVMKGINIYLWCNKKQIPDYLEFFVKEHRCKFDILFWNKPDALPTYSNKYLTDCEYLLYFHSTGKCFPQSYEDAKTVYTAPINRADKKLYGHPTIKPLDLTRKIIRNSSKEGDLVLDPFAGSGTTLVACQKENRRSIGIEISKEYCNTIQRRLCEVD